MGEVYFFFNSSENSNNRSWKLSLLIAPGSINHVRDLDLKKFLNRTVKNELRGLSYPEKIDILIPHLLEKESGITSCQAHRQSLNKMVDLVEMILPDWKIDTFPTTQDEVAMRLDANLIVRPLATNLLVALLSIFFLIQTIMAFIDPDFLQLGSIGVNSLNMAL